MDNQLLILAVIPGLLIIIYVYTKDRVEKEPLGLIIKLLLFGALSTFLAMITESIAQNILPQYPEGTIGYAFITAFFIAAFWEELLKFLLLKLGSWRNPNFNYRFDGIVYGVSVAVGFAVLENIEYVAMYGLRTAITRAFLAVPLHAFCGVFMGLFYAHAKRAAILGQKGTAFGNNVLAMVVPMCIHGVYDFFAMWRAEFATVGLLSFVVFLYIAAIATIRKASKEDFKAGFYPTARVIEYNFDINQDQQ